MTDVLPAESDLSLLYEEGPCLVVNKPPGVATQAPPGIDSLEIRLKQFLKRRDAKPGNIYLGVPHRLDRPVSGAIVFGRHVRATRRLAEQFERRTVEKVYWALVVGEVAPAEGTWQDRLRKIPDQARAEVVESDNPEGREAVLHYRRLATLGGASWLEIRLETGRMHQVRVQAASRGHPVLGDAAYGSTVPFGPRSDDPRLRAIALHARRLAFDHPMTRRRVSLVAPLSESWIALGVDDSRTGE